MDLQLGAPTLPAAVKAAAAALRVLLRLAREWESRGRERRWRTGEARREMRRRTGEMRGYGAAGNGREGLRGCGDLGTEFGPAGFRPKQNRTIGEKQASKHLAILEDASVNPAEAALAIEVAIAEHVGGLLHLLEREHHRAAAFLGRRLMLLRLP